MASPELVAQQQPSGNISILALKCHGGSSNCGWCCKIDGPQDKVTLGTSGVQMGFWISRLKRSLCVHLPRIEGAVDKVSRAAFQWRVEHLPQRRLLTPNDFNVAGCPAWSIVLVHVLWNGHWGYLFTQGLPDKLCEMGKEKTPKKKKREPRIGMAFFIFLKWMNDVTDGNICDHQVHGPVHFAALIVFKKRLVSKKLTGKWSGQ